MQTQILKDLQETIFEEFQDRSRFLKETKLSMKDLNISIDYTIDYITLAGEEFHDDQFSHYYNASLEEDDSKSQSAILKILELSHAPERSTVSQNSVDLTFRIRPTMITKNRAKIDCTTRATVRGVSIFQEAPMTCIYENGELVDVSQKLESFTLTDAVKEFCNAANVSIVEAPLRAYQLSSLSRPVGVNETELSQITDEQEAYEIFEHNEDVNKNYLLKLIFELEGYNLVDMHEFNEEFSFEIDVKRDVQRGNRMLKERTQNTLKILFDYYHKPRKSASVKTEKLRLSKSTLAHLYRFDKYFSIDAKNASLLKISTEDREIDVDGEIYEVTRMSIQEARFKIEENDDRSIAEIVEDNLDYEILEDFYIVGADRYKSESDLIEALQSQ